VYALGADFEIDVPLPRVERLFVDDRVSGGFAGMPRLTELFALGNREGFGGLTPEIEKLALGWGISTVPASSTLRRLWARYTRDDLRLDRFPNLQWLEITPRNRVAAELRAVELLERLELNMTESSVAKLGLIGVKDRLEYLRVYGGGLKSLEGVGRFGALRTAKFVLTRVESFSPLADTLVEDLVVDHRRPAADGFVGLGEMPALRRLHLETDLAVLERVADLHRAPALEVVDFAGSALGDHVVEAVAQIPTLRRVRMAGATKTQTARLVAARPDIEVLGGQRDSPPQPVNIMELEDGWSIFGDVAGLIGTPTNYAAETAIGAALDPAVLKQLSFDTEAGMFSAQSTDRAVIDLVAEMIERLARDGSQ
jgi:hypothetical protein